MKSVALIIQLKHFPFIGRGLSIQLDPAGHVIGEKEEMNPEEDICYTKNVTLPVS